MIKVLPPEITKSFIDVYVDNMDSPGMDKIADRLRKMLPPGIGDDGQNSQIPPQVQAQMQQLSQQNQQLVQHLNEAVNEIKTKKFELESKERIAAMGYQADIAIEHARLRARGSDKILDTEMDILGKRLDLLAQGQSLDSENVFSPQAGAQGAAPGQSNNGQPASANGASQ